MSEPLLLTTTDNPYNPFTQWYRWLAEDERLGHSTCSLLARVTNTADDVDDGSSLAAMYEIVKYNLSGKHMLVSQSTFDELIKLPLS